MTLAELRAAREKAGARVIALRDQANADGFVESAEWQEGWVKANAEYNSALQAEQEAERAQEARAARDTTANQIREYAEQAARADRGRLRTDYNPASDPRSRGVLTGATASDWTHGLRVWASAHRPDFILEDSDRAVLSRCRINLNSSEVHLPTSVAHLQMIEEFQEAFIEAHPRRRAHAMRQALASLNTMTPESGAYVAEPPQILRQLEINRLAFGGLLQVCTIRTTSTGEDIILPFSDDTTVKGRRISEDGPLGTEKNPKFGQMKWGAHKYTSDIIAVTFEMMRDAFFNLQVFIGDTGGMRLGRIQNYECTLGVGGSMPRGIVFAAPIGKTAASPTVITTDDIIDLEVSIDDAYAMGERVGYMMNKGILTYLRKLKDLEGRPFYTLGQETGRRDQLNGKPIFINYDMASAPVAGADVMLYGDYSKYWMRRVGGSRIVRDPYTQLVSNDRELFAVVEYADGNLVNSGTAPVKKLRMAAA